MPRTEKPVILPVNGPTNEWASNREGQEEEEKEARVQAEVDLCPVILPGRAASAGPWETVPGRIADPDQILRKEGSGRQFMRVHSEVVQQWSGGHLCYGERRFCGSPRGAPVPGTGFGLCLSHSLVRNSAFHE